LNPAKQDYKDNMHEARRILILGASYGSLLGIKLALGGHGVHFVCLPEEAALINGEGVRVRMPVKGREDLVVVDSSKVPGRVSAGAANAAAPGDYDLVVLAMQEPQFGAGDIRELLGRIVDSNVPCMSIMNMPPPPYLNRIPNVNADGCRSCYTAPAIWDGFAPRQMTLCSPDPQAFRPAGEKANVLQVRLATNFKAARFESSAHTALLRDLSADIDAVRFSVGAERLELPVKLRVHDSVFVPLAKWSMLIAGNYRCVQSDGARSIRDAVHSNVAESRTIYDWVVDLCKRLGAAGSDLVPFDKYATAALSLGSPSSAARALCGGARNIERVDKLVQSIGAQQGMRNGTLDGVVALVDHRLAANRSIATVDQAASA
jgi:hypothetical protein